MLASEQLRRLRADPQRHRRALDRLEQPAELLRAAERDLVGTTPRPSSVAIDEQVDDVLRHPAVRCQLAAGDRDQVRRTVEQRVPARHVRQGCAFVLLTVTQQWTHAHPGTDHVVGRQTAVEHGVARRKDVLEVLGGEVQRVERTVVRRVGRTENRLRPPRNGEHRPPIALS